jgi:hypothetical protein
VVIANASGFNSRRKHKPLHTLNSKSHWPKISCTKPAYGMQMFLISVVNVNKRACITCKTTFLLKIRLSKYEYQFAAEASFFFCCIAALYSVGSILNSALNDFAKYLGLLKPTW